MRMAPKLGGGVAVLVLCCGWLNAATFTHNFDMYGDYTEYLHSTSGVEVATESWPNGPTIYWTPTYSNSWGEVVYSYNLGFEIDTASVHASLLALTWYNSNAEAYLDVSPDGTNWTQVAVGGLELSTTPIDVSDILKGSDTALVRARLWSPTAAQFLRTAGRDNPLNQNKAPNVYEFQATDNAAVPEPTSLVLWAGLGAMGLVAARRRRRTA